MLQKGFENSTETGDLEAGADRPQVTVVIPAYNEALNIVETVANIARVMAELGRDGYEIIVVDDHSSDGTFEFTSSLTENCVRSIRLSKRSGSHVAIRAGLMHANGDAIICMSADGQDNPLAICDMVNQWKNGAQIVWALRRNRNDESRLARSFAKTFYWLLNSLSDTGQVDIDLSKADFYLLDRAVVQALNCCTERNTSLFGLVAWLGFRQVAIEYDRLPRRHGQSKWRFRSRLRLAKDWIIGFSGMPLKLMVHFGGCFVLMGFCYAGLVSYRALTGVPPQGWSSLMVAVLVVGGLQIAMLGIMGEYLWRSLDEVRKRPLYFVERASGPASMEEARNSSGTAPSALAQRAALQPAEGRSFN